MSKDYNNRGFYNRKKNKALVIFLYFIAFALVFLFFNAFSQMFAGKNLIEVLRGILNV